MTSIEIQPATLSPAQFKAARALASAYHHLWSGVPDGTYAIADIAAWSREHDSQSFPGIGAPWLTETVNSFRQVKHATGSGRLRWTIGESGNVVLHVYRPADLSSVRADAARTFAYAAIQPVEPPTENGILVAAIDILNGPEGGDYEKFSIGEITIGSSDYEKTHDEKVPEYKVRQVKDGWNYFGPDDGLRDDILFERHVAALVRPLVALLTANDAEPLYELSSMDEELEAARYAAHEEAHAAWRANVIEPAIARAKEILQPLFAIALPDPWQEPYWPEDREKFPEPETCYIKKTGMDAWKEDFAEHYVVVHRGERFPVESEHAAVHAVLLLQRTPEMSLIDAVKAAVVSTSYRPAESAE